MLLTVTVLSFGFSEALTVIPIFSVNHPLPVESFIRPCIHSFILKKERIFLKVATFFNSWFDIFFAKRKRTKLCKFFFASFAKFETKFFSLVSNLFFSCLKVLMKRLLEPLSGWAHASRTRNHEFSIFHLLLLLEEQLSSHLEKVSRIEP